MIAADHNESDRREAPFAARFAGTVPGFEAAFAQLRAALDAAGIAADARYRVELVFEEIVANIMRHAVPPRGGPPEIQATLRVDGDALVLTFDDDGAAFDPRVRDNPLPPKSLEDARVGGLGIMMVRRAASSIDYRRTADEHNRLTVTIARSGAGLTFCQNTASPKL